MASTPKDFYNGLPKKRMGAGALILDDQQRVLIVKPTYKEGWEIPGGIVEQNESPAACVVREVKEELGLDIPACPGLRFLCLDYLPHHGDKTEALMFVFYGGTLSADAVKKISLPADELSAFEFLPLSAAVEKLGDKLGARIARAYRAFESGAPVYFEDNV